MRLQSQKQKLLFTAKYRHKWHKGITGVLAQPSPEPLTATWRPGATHMHNTGSFLEENDSEFRESTTF